VGTKKTEVNEASTSRLLRLTLLCLMFTMLLTDRLRLGPLAGARHHLGEYWSDRVALKVDHRLIRSGPYALLRRPIHSGVLLAVLGSALAIGEWRGVVVLLVMTANYWIKAQREDRILSAKFGDSFTDYKRHAGFLVPKR